MPGETDPRKEKEAFAESEIVAVLRNLPEDRVKAIAKLIVFATLVDDTEQIHALITFYADPRIGSVLDIASHLDSDALDELLFQAEDLARDSLLD